MFICLSTRVYPVFNPDPVSIDKNPPKQSMYCDSKSTTMFMLYKDRKEDREKVLDAL